MSQSLIAKIRAARQSVVEIGQYGFTIRRPTDLQIAQFNGQLDQTEILRRFVVDWVGVHENDLYAGGTSDPAPFDAELFVEWIADQPDYWDPITTAIIAAYKAHAEARDAHAKN